MARHTFTSIEQFLGPVELARIQGGESRAALLAEREGGRDNDWQSTAPGLRIYLTQVGLANALEQNISETHGAEPINGAVWMQKPTWHFRVDNSDSRSPQLALGPKLPDPEGLAIWTLPVLEVIRIEAGSCLWQNRKFTWKLERKAESHEVTCHFKVIGLPKGWGEGRRFNTVLDLVFDRTDDPEGLTILSVYGVDPNRIGLLLTAIKASGATIIEEY